MKADLAAVVRKVAHFLEKPLPSSQEAFDQFLDHLSFNKMKKNAAVNKADFLEVSRLLTSLITVWKFNHFLGN